MASLFSLFASNRQAGFASRHPELICPVCGGNSTPFDVVDFNKCCEEPKGKFLPLAGVPIYYYRCGGCGFCFAPEIARWSLAEFEERIYNDDYALVDPDYIGQRPQANAASLLAPCSATAAEPSRTSTTAAARAC